MQKGLLAICLSDLEFVNESATGAVISQDDASAPGDISCEHRRIALLTCQLCLETGIEPANVPLDIELHAQRLSLG